MSIFTESWKRLRNVIQRREGRRSRAAGKRRGGKRNVRRLLLEQFEGREMMAMDIGMNVDNVVDYVQNWMFTDVFQSSRPWISHAYNTATRQVDFNGGSPVPVQVDDNGWPTRLATWTNASGQLMQQRLGTLMFRELNGQYPAGNYRVEWDGTGDVQFSFDAWETSRGRTSDGHNFANLNVTPGNGGIYLVINSMSEADPIRDVHVWMPDYNGQSFAGQRWRPGANFSPFHPLYKERLDDFGIVRFMQAQETNTSDIRTWSDRRDANDSRQNSGNAGPMANGLSVEHMVQLANELDADPWFNMPHMADDNFVRNFATYVRDNLEPGLTAYVEWSNEVWNYAPGFESYFWIADQIRLPENSGLTHWQFVGREAARDMNIWSDVFAGQTNRIVRTVGGQASNPWVTERIAENMGGAFDAIAIAPYFGLGDTQRAALTANSTVDEVLTQLAGNLPAITQFTLNHQRIADEYSQTLGRDIQLLAYEGGQHLDGRNAPYQTVFFNATKDPRMADLTRLYLQQQNAAGLDAYVHYKLTDRDRATQWGNFGVLNAQDQSLSSAHVYRTLLEADAGTLFSNGPTLVTLSVADSTAHEASLGPAGFRVTRGGDLTQPLTVNYSVAGNASSGADYQPLAGTLRFAANQNSAIIAVRPINDTVIEANESVIVTLQPGTGYSLIGGSTATGTVTIVSDDRLTNAPTVNIIASDPNAAEAGRDPGVFTITRSNGNTANSLTVWFQFGMQTAQAADFDPISQSVQFAPGQTSATVTLRPLDDTLVENRESVILVLNDDPVNYRLGANRSARVNITDNDGVVALPTVTIAATDSAAAEANRDPGTFTVTRTGSTAAALTVNFTIGGSATIADVDPVGSSVTIPAGQAAATITVRPIDDSAVEPAETLSIALATNAAYSIGFANSATVTIADNDSQAILPVLMVIGNNDFYYTEYSHPRSELEAAGIPVIVAAGRRELSIPHANTGYTSGNGAVMPDLALADVNPANYSAIVFVGGWGASQYQYAFPGTYTNVAYNGTVAIRERANQLIGEFAAQGKLVTAVCHGVSVLAWSRVNGQSLLQGRTVTTAHFTTPANNVPEATLYRWHSEVNGAAAVFTGGALGDTATRNDDVVVDGNIITGENFDSARQLGITIAQRLLQQNQPTVTATASDPNAAEANRDTGTVTVTRSGSPAAALVVNYSLGGMAGNGSDYDSLRGNVLIQPGQTSGTITVRPIDDSTADPNETANVSLAANAAYRLGSATQGTVTIADNDAPVAAPLPVLMVIANRDFYYQEYADPRARFEAAGIPVVVAAARRELSTPHVNSGQGSASGQVMPDIALADANAANYSAIVFVGGWGASQYQYAFNGTYSNAAYNGSADLRQQVNQLVNDFVAQDKYVTALCHGVSILAWARVNNESLLRGRRVSTYGGLSPASTIADAQLSRWHADVNGATVFTNGQIGNQSTAADDVIVDGRIITAENYDSASQFGLEVANRLLGR